MRSLWAISLSPRNERRVALAASMKALLLNLYYPPDTSATAKMAAAFIEPLSEKSSVTVICGRPSYDPTERRPWRLWQTEQLNGVRVIRLGSTDYPRTQMSRRVFNYLSVRRAERSTRAVRLMRCRSRDDRSALRRNRRRIRRDAQTQAFRLQHPRHVSRHGGWRLDRQSPA